MLIIRAIDFETCGSEPSDPIVEIGWCDLIIDTWNDHAEISGPYSKLCDPGKPIPAEAMAVHHIRDSMVAGAVDPITVIGSLFDIPQPFVFAAHVADYEKQYLSAVRCKWLCSYKTALRVWPDAPSHKLQVLRYWLNLAADDLKASPPHRAGPDAYLCALLVAELIKHKGVDDLIRWSNGPALLVKVGFGKHRGKLWSQVAQEDHSYLDWIVNKSEIDDRDVRATAKYYLLGRHRRAKDVKESEPTTTAKENTARDAVHQETRDQEKRDKETDNQADQGSHGGDQSEKHRADDPEQVHKREQAQDGAEAEGGQLAVEDPTRETAEGF